MKKKAISLLLVAVMLIGILPLQAMAADRDATDVFTAVDFDVKAGVPTVKVKTNAVKHTEQKNVFYLIVTADDYDNDSYDTNPSAVCKDTVVDDLNTKTAGTYAIGKAEVASGNTEFAELTLATAALSKKAETYHILVWSAKAGGSDVANVYDHEFKTDANGDLYVATATVPADADLIIGAEKTITIALNGILTKLDGSDYVELAANELPADAVTIASKDATNNPTTSGATVAYVPSTADVKTGSIQVTIPAAYMVLANEGHTITVTVDKTKLLDADGTTYSLTENADHTERTSATFTIIAKEQENFKITSAETGTFGQAYTLTTSGGNGDGAVTYAITTDADSIATLGTGDDANKLTFSGANTGSNKVKITATKEASGTYKAATATIEIAVGKATPVVTVPSATDENTTLQQIVDGVTVKGVGDVVLNNGTFKLFDGDTEITNLTAKVVADKTYKYTYTPDDTTNYGTVTDTKTLLPQTKATVKFEVAAADADKGSIAAADATAEFDKDAAVTFPTVTLSEGFTLKGWTVKGGDGKLVDTATAKAVDGTVYVAVFEAKPAHAAYMFGTTKDGTAFEPDRDMTRAEVAVMIANLEEYDKNVDYSKDLKVPADLLAEKDNLTKWTDNGFNKLCYILKNKLMQGRDDGNFHPYDTITRQEMAIVLGRYLGLEQATGADQFKDLTGTAVYAEGKGYINALKAKGKIDGFPDGGYHPTENLTRAQAAKMMNYATEREPDIAKMKAANVTTTFTDVKVFAGNSQAEWALYNIIEASRNHYESEFH